ncbi:MAG: hypothetical protein WC718_12250 [Phycisphaerales bacterium]|jgi:hypothetical protein
MYTLALLVTVAYRPFLDPLNLDRVWFLLLFPMAFFVSLAYKGVRVGEMKHLPREVAVMTAQIVLGMIALGLASYLFVQHVVPLIAPK